MLPKLQEDIVRRGRQVENRTERVRMGYLVEGDIAQDEGCLEVSTVPDHLQTLPSPDAVAAIAFEELFLKFSAFWKLLFICQCNYSLPYPLSVLLKP